MSPATPNTLELSERMQKTIVAVLCLALPHLSLAESAKFLDYHDYLLPGTPEAVAIADVNRDGIPDAVVGTSGGTQVLLGQGNGTFRPPSTVASSFVRALAVADFNNDGKPDIAATVLTNGTEITLALGNGNGAFQPPVVLPISCIDCYLAAADFNGDGNMDLAVASSYSVTVFLGNGDGTFTGGLPAYSLQSAVAVTAGDANLDGIPDLIVTDFGAGTEVVLLGNGDGSFNRTDYPAGNSPFQAVLTDFNGDGLPDLAAADRNSGSVVVMLNQGAGVFGPSASFLAGCSPYQGCTFQGLAAGDFNGDGRIDLATPGAILQGNGDGTFQAPRHFHSGAFPWLVASADFNHDGYSDLLLGNSAATNISILMGTPLSMTQPDGFASGTQPKDAAAADFNGDGNADLAVAASADNQVNIFLGQGNGRFTKGVSLAVRQPGAVLAADLNHDGKTDLAVSSDYGTSIFLGNGDGTFTAGATYPTFYGDCTFNAIQNTAAPCFATADFNGDGIPDLVGALWIEDTVSFLLGNGDGTFHLGPQNLTVADVPQGIAVGDFNHDGKIDVAVSGYYGSVTVFPGNGDSTFGAGVAVATGTTIAVGLAVGDVNGDGNLDIVLAGGSSDSEISLGLFAITGNGDMTFNAPVPLLADEGPNGVVLADLNGDGLIDIASANLLGDDVTVLINQGNLTFAPETLYGAGGGPVVVRSANLHANGQPDLIVVNQNSNNVSILLHAPQKKTME